MTLADAEVGSHYRLLPPSRDIPRADTLPGIGLQVGTEIVVLRIAPFGGPVLVELPATGARIALGRRLAQRLPVEPWA